MFNEIKIDPYGFREYDARWIYKKDIDLFGIESLGKGLGTQIIKHTNKDNFFTTSSSDFCIVQCASIYCFCIIFD